MREGKSSSAEPQGERLEDMIKKAKDEKRLENFNKMVGSVLKLWYYQYLENFHCRPESVEDMAGGIKYLLYSRTDR